MVSSGAASAMTLGTAGVLTGGDPKKIVDLPNLAGMKTEVIMQKAHRFGTPRGAQLRREDRRGRDRGRTRGRDHAADRDDAVLQQQQLGRADSRRGVRAPRQEARRDHDERLRGRRAACVENLWKYTAMAIRPVVFSAARASRPRAPACCSERKDLVAAARAERRAQWQLHRPRHEGQQGGDARHARGGRAVRETRSRRPRPRVHAPRQRDPQEPRGPRRA